MSYFRCDVPEHVSLDAMLRWSAEREELQAEVRRQRAIVRELERRCEAVAKYTEDPDAYDLLNDAGRKAEEYVQWASQSPRA